MEAVVGLSNLAENPATHESRHAGARLNSPAECGQYALSHFLSHEIYIGIITEHVCDT